jgi:hypothetical protein
MRRSFTQSWASARTRTGEWLKAATLFATGLLLALSLALAAAAAGQEREPGPAAASLQTASSQTAPDAPAAGTKGPDAPKPAARTGAPSTPPGAAEHRSGKGPRTLDEITIEGEIAVPQVLFITARERKHYQDFLHRNYLKNSRELCRETPVPVRLASWLRP